MSHVIAGGQHGDKETKTGRSTEHQKGGREPQKSAARLRICRNRREPPSANKLLLWLGKNARPGTNIRFP
jgi:hypothetical protein